MFRLCVLVLTFLCVFKDPTPDIAVQDCAAERGVILQLESEPSRWGPPKEWKEGWTRLGAGAISGNGTMSEQFSSSPVHPGMASTVDVFAPPRPTRPIR